MTFNHELDHNSKLLTVYNTIHDKDISAKYELLYLLDQIVTDGRYWCRGTTKLTFCYVTLRSSLACLFQRLSEIISSLKGKGKVVPVLFLTEHHFMKAYWGSGCIVSRTL
jgi:hypothetical protein